MRWYRMSMVVCVAAGWASLAYGPLCAADKPVKQSVPTVAEALKAFDPEKLPLLESDQPVEIKRVGGFSYQAKGAPEAAFKFYQQALAKLKWKEQPNSYLSDMSCSGTFSKDGYLLSLSTSPVGEKDRVLVSLHNHSKVDLKSLPAPKGAKPFYSVPAAEAYLTPQSRDATASEVAKSLAALGWEPYGTAGEQLFFRQNAVRLSANVAAAPAQNNQTAITYSTEQLSAEIPAPAKTVQLQYSDLTKHLMFDYDAEPVDEAFTSMPKFYRETLGKTGWKPTTEKSIVTDGRHMVIYRNPAKEMLTLEMFEFEGRLRVQLKHQSAAEVAALDAEYAAAIEKKKKDDEAKKSKPKPETGKLSLTLPVDAKEVEVEKAEIKFTLGAGKAKPFVESLRKKLKDEGWKEQTATLDAMFGVMLLKRGDQDLTMMYVETGVLPAEVTITASGVELEQAKAKK